MDIRSRPEVTPAAEVLSMFPLSEKVVLVTGAVGNLGAAVARGARHAGARTILVDRSPDRLPVAFPELAGSPDHLLLGGVDLASPEATDGMVARVVERFGRLDGLVNTVGGFRGGQPVHEADLADWDFLLGVNLRTTLLACRAAAPVMLRQGSGRIVNVASRAALGGDAGLAAYSAAKAAVLRLTESLAAELKDGGVGVNCVLPGTMDTPQNRQAMPDADVSGWVELEAVAEVILFLLSDSARGVVGAAVPVYGRG